MNGVANFRVGFAIRCRDTDGVNAIQSNSSTTMKLPSVIYAIVLGLSASVQAQDKATDPNEPSKPTTPPGQVRTVIQPPGTDTSGPLATSYSLSLNANITMELTSSRLVDAVDEIAGHINDPKRVEEGGKPLMPNLIYSSEDVPELAMPGKFRLTGVTPVQAVALACAAAGCTMEPIYAPAEEAALPGASGATNPGKVIGYRIVRASASGGNSFVSPFPTATVTQLAGGGVSKGGGGGGGGMAPIAPSSTRNILLPSPKSAPSVDTTERVVRVYALGAILGGGEGSSEELKRRYALIGGACDLIARTLENADLKADKSPEISLHSDLRVIVAKATAAQHDIILQVLQALKENETHTAQTAKPAPSAETILPTPTPAHSAEKPKSNP